MHQNIGSRVIDLPQMTAHKRLIANALFPLGPVRYASRIEPIASPNTIVIRIDVPVEYQRKWFESSLLDVA